MIILVKSTYRQIEMLRGLIFLMLASILSLSKPIECISKNEMLLLISFDGFRWDYLQMYNLTNFTNLRDTGSHAEFIYNSFSTVTFPNHWTIVTGLYEESHGIVQNSMYDPVLKQNFSYTIPKSQTHDWYGQNNITEPIWTTNQRGGNGRRSAAEWVGAGVEFGNESIIYIPYGSMPTYESMIDKFFEYFMRDIDPINFAAIYIDEPDHTGHLYGPYSQQMKEKLDYIDGLLGYILNKVKSNGLFDKLNIIVTSDHGMDSISEKNTVFLDSHIDTSLFQAYGSRAVYNLFVNDTDLDYVYSTLKKIENIDVYKKEEIPDELHYKNNVRVGDILLVAHINHSIYINNQSIDWSINNGDHGYYNNIPSMHPIFMAHGPAFKKSFKIPPFKNVDIYPLMCHVLGVKPAVNNGTLDSVLPMLVADDDIENSFNYLFLLLLVIPIVIITLTAICLCMVKRRRGPNSHSGYATIDATSNDSVIPMPNDD